MLVSRFEVSLFRVSGLKSQKLHITVKIITFILEIFCIRRQNDGQKCIFHCAEYCTIIKGIERLKIAQ